MTFLNYIIPSAGRCVPRIPVSRERKVLGRLVADRLIRSRLLVGEGRLLSKGMCTWVASGGTEYEEVDRWVEAGSR